MSERPNDTPDGQPNDAAALSEPTPDDAPEGNRVAAASPEVAAAAVPEVAAPPEVEIEVAASPEVAAPPEDAAEVGVGPESEPELEAGSEIEGEVFEPEGENVEPDVTAPVRPMTPAERRASRSGLAHGQLPIDPALRIKDRASAILVLVTVGVFAVIFLNAVVLGHGGLLTPLPTATPVPTITAAPGATPAPSDTPAPSESPAPS